MSAAFLDRTYNTPQRRQLEIVLVEAPAIGRIGVGEATLPTMRDFCSFLGIPEELLMQRTNATLKHGISLEGWNGPDSQLFHPFEALAPDVAINAGPSWLARRARGTARAFYEEMGVQSRLAYAGYSPKPMMDSGGYQSRLPYAYHFDAEAFADLLKEISLARGVVHVEGEVAEVGQTEHGDVSQLRLADRRVIEGDFFIDCSGFAALLNQKALGTPFVSFADDLLCDRAIAMPVPYAADEPIPPYTRAIAQSSGWRWQIGLQNRIGTGYVYSSAFQSQESAEMELRRALACAGDPPARHLKFRVGRPETTWNRNVVAVGLAGGFIEPLESTSIHMIEIALQSLVRYFPLSGINPAARDRFNIAVNERYAELRDFIVLHYCLSTRRDTPFWREVTQASHVPESLKARLELWRDRHPSAEDFAAERYLFSHHSWQAILYGMDAADPRAIANADYWLGDVDGLVQQIDNAVEAAKQDLPSHMIWLQGLRSIAVNHPGW